MGIIEDLDSLRRKLYSRRIKDRECLIYPYRVNKNGKGYGHISYKGKPYLAHRVAWFLVYEQWPENELNHRCENKLCTKVSHLEDITRLEHVKFTYRHSTHICYKGHEKKYYSKTNRWVCLACQRDYDRKHRIR